MQEDIVFIKKKNMHLEILLSSNATYQELFESMCERLNTLKNFLSGSGQKVLIAGKEFSKVQENEIKKVLQNDFELQDIEFTTYDEIREKEIMQESAQKITKKNEKNEKEDKSVFKIGNVRSGQIITSKGDLTIVGDVNPGAELVAKGNICVMGHMRGIAHAGAYGDGNAIIVATRLEAKQLRISDCIGIAPEDNKSIGKTEIAKIIDGRIIIEQLK